MFLNILLLQKATAKNCFDLTYCNCSGGVWAKTHSTKSVSRVRKKTIAQFLWVAHPFKYAQLLPAFHIYTTKAQMHLPNYVLVSAFALIALTVYIYCPGRQAPQART